MDVQIDKARDQHLSGVELGQPTLGPELSSGFASLVRARLQYGADVAIPVDNDQRVCQRLDRAPFWRVQGGAEKSLVDDRLLA